MVQPQIGKRATTATDKEKPPRRGNQVACSATVVTEEHEGLKPTGESAAFFSPSCSRTLTWKTPGCARADVYAAEQHFTITVHCVPEEEISLIWAGDLLFVLWPPSLSLFLRAPWCPFSLQRQRNLPKNQHIKNMYHHPSRDSTMADIWKTDMYIEGMVQSETIACYSTVVLVLWQVVQETPAERVHIYKS